MSITDELREWIDSIAWLDDSVSQAHKKILAIADRIDAENAELRKHVRMPDEPLEIDEKDFYVRAFIKWATEEQPEVKRLEAENAKLRELVRELLTDQDAWDYDYFKWRLRELGVEV